MSQPPEFRFGEGRISGVISIALGGLCVLAVLCFRYPELLTTPDLRAAVPLWAVRGLLFGSLLAAMALALLSYVLGAKRRLAGIGLALSTLAIALGGAWVETPTEVHSAKYLGVDWFVLDLLILALIFVPLERSRPRDPAQRIFRRGWRTDLVHFFVNHLLVQVTVLLSMAPAVVLFGGAALLPFQQAVGSQPAVLQFVEALVLADLFQYAAHRTMHAVPRLWRIHAIHHSSEALDWLAGSRLHLFDIVITRAVTFLPLFVCGFERGPLLAYLVFVSFHAVLIHANLGLRFGPLRHIVTTPAYHHWHHAREPQAIDKNFAVHVPLIDRIFGTQYAPTRWPKAYGIEESPVPENYAAQCTWPFSS